MRCELQAAAGALSHQKRLKNLTNSNFFVSNFKNFFKNKFCFMIVCV